MLITALPYSKKRFKIKKLTFEQILDISHLIQDGSCIDIVNYLEDFFCLGELSVIDKFYVLLRARELFIDHTITLVASDNSTVKINIASLLDELNKVTDFQQEIIVDNICLLLDAPSEFIINDEVVVHDLYDSIINSITIDTISINYKKLSPQERVLVLEALPPGVYTKIKTYIKNTSAEMVLFKGKKELGIHPIIVDFFSDTPSSLLKSLYCDYNVHACRDIVTYLSPKIGSSILLKSTIRDITAYIQEISTQRNSGTGSNIGSNI